MRLRYFCLVAVCVLAGVFSVGNGIAASQDAAPSAPALDLSSDIQSPGSEVSLTLSLSVPDGVEIGKVTSEITFPGKLLIFEEAKRGLSAEAIGAEIDAVVQPSDSSPDNSVLRVTVTAKAGDWIPPGMVADLMFKISEKAPNEQSIPLKNKVTAWTPKAPPTPVESMTGKDGEVQVTATPPVFACFFYMH